MGRCLRVHSSSAECGFDPYRELKPFNTTVIQIYAPTSNAEEAERFSEDLQDLLELTPKKDVLFIIGGNRGNRQIWPWNME